MTIHPVPKPTPSVKAKKPVKRRNAKRYKANHERAYGPYADYIRSLPCCVCGLEGYTVAAHTETGGKGRKADSSTLVPLCSSRIALLKAIEGCHEESHRGVQTFEQTYHVDLKAIAAALYAEFQSTHQ